MSVTFHSHPPHDSDTRTSESRPPKRRAPWRQSLVDAENGVRLSLRGGSMLFAYFFAACFVLVTGMLVGLSAVEWSVLVLSLGVAISAELFQQMIRAISQDSDSPLSASRRETLHIGAGAVSVAVFAAVIAAALTLGSRLLTTLR